MNIEDFWSDIYSRVDKDEGEIPPRQISILLDQSQRQLMMIVDSEFLGELGGTYDFVSLQDLEEAIGGYEMGEQTISQFKAIGIDGMFWGSGPYDDLGSYAWPEGQTLKPELFRIVGVQFTPKYLRELNDLSAGVGLFSADESSWREIRNISGAGSGNILQGDDFYERVTPTLDLLQGEHATTEGTYNVERDLQLKWAIFGENLITWPVVDTLAAVPMRVWAIFYPERFLDMNGEIKTSFANDRDQCQMPSRFWPVMIEWVISRVKALGTGDQASAMSMRDVLQALNLGDELSVRSEKDRLRRE